MLSLLVAAAVVWTQPLPIVIGEKSPMSRLSADQTSEFEWIWPKVTAQLDGCGEASACKAQIIEQFVDGLNAVRELEYVFGYTGIAARSRRWCEMGEFVLERYSNCLIVLSHADALTIKNVLEYKSYGVTLDGYYALETGMGYGEVSMMLGRGGQQRSRSEVGNQSASVYDWTTRNGGYLIVTFQNGKLVSKGQSNLR